MVQYGENGRSLIGVKVCLTTNSPNTVHRFCSGQVGRIKVRIFGARVNCSHRISRSQPICNVTSAENIVFMRSTAEPSGGKELCAGGIIARTTIPRQMDPLEEKDDSMPMVCGKNRLLGPTLSRGNI